MFPAWLMLTTGSMVVSWDAPQECIDLAELRARVDAEYSSENAKIRRQLRGKIEPDGAGWRVTLEVYEDGRHLGDRLLSLEDSGCRSHDETITLVSALLLEHGPAPELSDDEKSQENDKLRKTSADAAAPETIQVETIAPEQAAPVLRGRAFAVISSSFGWTPEPSFGPGGGLGWGIGHYLWLDLTGSYLAPREFEKDGSGVKTLGGRVSLRACVEWANQHWLTDACIGGGWIGLKATGTTSQENRSEFFSTGEVMTSWIGGVNLTPNWSLLVDASLALPFGRGRFVVLNGEAESELFSTNQLIPALSVGVRRTF